MEAEVVVAVVAPAHASGQGVLEHAHDVYHWVCSWYSL